VILLNKLENQKYIQKVTSNSSFVVSQRCHSKTSFINKHYACRGIEKLCNSKFYAVQLEKIKNSNNVLFLFLIIEFEFHLHI